MNKSPVFSDKNLLFILFICIDLSHLKQRGFDLKLLVITKKFSYLTGSFASILFVSQSRSTRSAALKAIILLSLDSTYLKAV